jgi:hypothetical protein
MEIHGSNVRVIPTTTFVSTTALCLPLSVRVVMTVHEVEVRAGLTEKVTGLSHVPGQQQKEKMAHIRKSRMAEMPLVTVFSISIWTQVWILAARPHRSQVILAYLR